MPRDPKEAVAAALAEQAPDDDDLRDWLTDRAEFVLDALAADDFRVVDGRAVAETLRLTDFAMREAQVALVTYVPAPNAHVERDFQRLAEARRLVESTLKAFPPEPDLTEEQLVEAAAVVRAALDRRFGDA